MVKICATEVEISHIMELFSYIHIQAFGGHLLFLQLTEKCVCTSRAFSVFFILPVTSIIRA